jgi:hypothetical protein
VSDDNKLDFVLDLDGSEFAHTVTESIEKVGELGAKLGGIAEIAGLVGAAYLALKASLDLTFEAENIQAINEQFEALARNAGIAGDKLKTGLEKSANGMITQRDLMQAANRAMIEMGASAQRLPELLDVARKAAAVFGGDVLERFEQINQAVATGATRQLRAIGLQIDNNKAMREYANSIGVTVSSLSQAGEAQARLNAVLEKARTSQNGVNNEVYQAHNAWQQFKTALAEAGEVATLAYAKIAGPTVKAALTGLAKWAHDAKVAVQAAFGDGAEQASAKVEQLRGEIGRLETGIKNLEARPKMGGLFDAENAQFLAQMRQQLAGYRGELEKLEQDEKNLKGPEDKKPGAASAKGGGVDHDKQLQSETRFNQELVALHAQRVQSEIAAARSLEEMDNLADQRRVVLAEETSSQIEQVRSRRKMGEIATDAQANQLIDEIERTHFNKMVALEDDLKAARIKALDQYAAHATSTANGVARAFEVQAKKSEIAIKDFATLGTIATSSFQKSAVSNFEAFGAGTKNGADAAKGIMFGMMADISEQYGEMILLMSIWPPNPVGIAAGGALLALAGFLRSQADSAPAATGGAAAISSGYSSGGAGSIGDTLPTPQATAEAQKQKMVTINIQGHYLDTESSRMWLVEQIRQASDATDFSVRSS